MLKSEAVADGHVELKKKEFGLSMENGAGFCGDRCELESNVLIAIFHLLLTRSPENSSAFLM